MKFIKYIATFVTLTLGLSACTLNFEEINRNPNSILNGQITTAYSCFEPIIYGVGRSNQRFAYYYNNEIVQMTAATGSNTRQEHMYNIASAFQTVWDDYARYGYDCENMIKIAKGCDDAYLHGVGLILKAFCLGNLTSLYGDIPYTEAYQGDSNLAPAFDSQEDVFKYLIRDLDSASEILARNPKPQKTGIDPVFNDSAAGWRKFANSLRLRYLCRMTGISDSYWAEIQKMLDAPADYPVFASNDDNAAVAYTADDPYKPYFLYNESKSEVTNSDVTMRRTTEQVVKMMAVLSPAGTTEFEDIRLPIWAVTNKNGNWYGTWSGCSEAQKKEVEKKSLTVPNAAVVKSVEHSSALMDYSEILFIYAEGVLRGKLNVTGKTAKDLYEAAVTSNMEKWSPFSSYNKIPKPLNPQRLADFFASAIGSWDAVAAGTSIYASEEELLLSQKWLSLYYVGFEQFNEWRRTEYPRIKIGDGTVYNDHEYPTRFSYPNYTVATNPVNVNSALSRMGGENDMHTALDWSYKKNNNGTHRDPYTSAD